MKCANCDGYGLVADYGNGEDFYGDKECPECEGTGMRNMETYDLIAHLHRQKAFSEKTFGPGERTQGITDHIERQLKEVRDNPHDIYYWIDLVLLALDGALRHGFTPEQIAADLEEKQTRNENRKWPDWKTADPNKAIEHVAEDLEEVVRTRMADIFGIKKDGYFV